MGEHSLICLVFKSEYGGVAQLGEHLLCKQGVIGSIPFISTKVRYREANRTSARFHFVKLASLRNQAKKFDGSQT